MSQHLKCLSLTPFLSNSTRACYPSVLEAIEPRGGDPIQMIGTKVVSDTFLKQLITYLEYRQSRVDNAMDDLVNVVNSVVVDASVYAFAAQTVTLVFSSLSIFSANLFLPAIVDESCTLLSTSVRIGALRVVRIDPSNSPTVLPA